MMFTNGVGDAKSITWPRQKAFYHTAINHEVYMELKEYFSVLLSVFASSNICNAFFISTVLKKEQKQDCIMEGQCFHDALSKINVNRALNLFHSGFQRWDYFFTGKNLWLC